MSGLVGLCVLPALILAAPALPRFESTVKAVRLDVVVSRGGVPVAGLTPDDFEVLDDGVPQKVEVVSRSERAVHVVLVLDLSESLNLKARAELRKAAESFLQRLEPGDRATLLTFTHDLALVSGPGEPQAVLGALTEGDDFGLTALYDAVYAGMTVAGAAPGRPVVVVFTDGQDRLSWLSPSQVLLAAQRLEATVHVVQGGDASRPAGLVQIVEETGGRIWDRSAGKGLEIRFASVLAEVKNRYLLSYAVEGAVKPGWHTLEVRLKGRKGDVRTRRGYMASDRPGGG